MLTFNQWPDSKTLKTRLWQGPPNVRKKVNGKICDSKISYLNPTDYIIYLIASLSSWTAETWAWASLFICGTRGKWAAICSHMRTNTYRVNCSVANRGWHTDLSNTFCLGIDISVLFLSIVFYFIDYRITYLFQILKCFMIYLIIT